MYLGKILSVFLINKGAPEGAEVGFIIIIISIYGVVFMLIVNIFKYVFERAYIVFKIHFCLQFTLSCQNFLLFYSDIFISFHGIF